MSTDEPVLTEAEKIEALKFWVMFCFAHPNLVEAYDKLMGTNIAGMGTDLERAIDQATGRADDEYRGFIEFCLDMGTRIPPEAFG